jgi:hypothetical protein
MDEHGGEQGRLGVGVGDGEGCNKGADSVSATMMRGIGLKRAQSGAPPACAHSARVLRPAPVLFSDLLLA